MFEFEHEPIVDRFIADNTAQLIVFIFWAYNSILFEVESELRVNDNRRAACEASQ